VRSTQPTQAQLVPSIIIVTFLFYKISCCSTVGLDIFSFLYFLPILNRFLAFSAVGQKHCRTVRLGAASIALCFFLFSACFICHRQRKPANQLTAARLLNYEVTNLISICDTAKRKRTSEEVLFFLCLQDGMTPLYFTIFLKQYLYKF